ncbi:MAG: heme exporter protein CcmD [Rhodanobacter sp.]
MIALALQPFLAMGGYAAYVWPAYAIFFIVLVADSVVPTVRRRRALREIRAQMARHDARRGTSTTIPSPASTR